MPNKLLYCQYKASKQGKTGLTPTIDVYRITRSTGASSQIVTGGSATEIGGGFYGYLLNVDLVNYDYLGKFITSDGTVDDKEPGALWTDYGNGAIIFPAGAITYTYTVTDNVTLLPIEGVDVWFATDNAFANIIWRGITDTFGVARDVNNALPKLDAGTYYIRLQKTGYSFSDDTEIVS